MKTITFLTLILVLCTFACQSNRAFKKAPVSFAELWQADTCGTKGYRAFVIEYIDENKYYILEGKSVKYIEHYFGEPDTKRLNEEWGIIHYNYNCSAIEIKENGDCWEPTATAYHINIDAKTRKVIDATRALYCN